MLAVAAEDGRGVQVTAELKSIIRHPTHEARHFELTIAPPEAGRLPIVRVQLNGQSADDDERRLKEIAADLLSTPEPIAGIQEMERATDHGLPVLGTPERATNGGREA